jgi:hypothetical protein
MQAYFGNPIMPGTLGEPIGRIKSLLTLNLRLHTRQGRLNETSTYASLKKILKNSKQMECAFLPFYKKTL